LLYLLIRQGRLKRFGKVLWKEIKKWMSSDSPPLKPQILDENRALGWVLIFAR
jgi:hypothetical protein